MPDIFGKNEREYSHLVRIREKGFADAHAKALKQRGLVHSFDALPSMHSPRPMPFNDVEANAQAVGFLTNNLMAIQAQIEEILYTGFRLNDLFPIITNIPAGARTYSYRVMDKAGMGKFIDYTGGNAGNAGVSMRNVPYSLEYGGIVPMWTLEDLRQAAFAGMPLDSEIIGAATDGCMNHIEMVGLIGDTNFGLTGLTNQSTIPIVNSAKTFANMTDLEMVAWVQTYVSKLIEDTKEIFPRQIGTGLTIYLPVQQYNVITTKPLGTNVDKTVWEFVRTMNPWTYRTGQPLNLRSVAEFSTAGSGGVARALFGYNNERVMEMAMPISPRVIRTLDLGYTIQAPMEYKISGLNVKRPTAMLYVDAI